MNSTHDHVFGENLKKPGELRTLVVLLLSGATMLLEIGAGIAYGSMALLADGLHMASHTTALVISMFAYVYSRRHAYDQRFCFGTGKVNSLAGFTGAVLLAAFALIMLWESVQRLIAPIDIAFDQALVVAVIGLLVNGVSVVILGHSSANAQDERREHEHRHHVAAEAHGGDSPVSPHHDQHQHDHNLRSAYLHVLADALTSVLAIMALLAGRFLGLSWLDPVMGVVGATLVARWSVSLVRTTSRVLLDLQGPEVIRADIRRAVEAMDDTSITDLHLWSVAPGKYSLILAVTTSASYTPADYRQQLPRYASIVHASIEVTPR